MLELIVLIIIIALVMLLLYFNGNYIFHTSQIAETFENHYLQSCPEGFKSFYDNDGDIICCDGNVIANRCLSDNKCKLNGKGTPDMPNCVEAIIESYSEKAKLMCPPSMMTYFEDKSKGIKGCTNGRLNDTLNGPKFNNQSMCKIYSSQDLNIKNKDSCYNQKQLDTIECFGQNCTKELHQPNPNAPPLVAVGFTDNSGMHHIAYSHQSMENYLNSTNPSWKNQGIDLSKNINIAEVAKAHYIDRNMDQSHIQF